MTPASTYDLHRLSPLGASHLAVSDEDEDLRGRLVRDERWKRIGRIRDLVIDPVEQRVRFLEIASGGVLGLWPTTSLVPIAAVAHVAADAVSIRTQTATRSNSLPYDPQLVPEPVAVGSRAPEPFRPSWPTYWPYYTADWPYGPGPRPPAV